LEANLENTTKKPAGGLYAMFTIVPPRYDLVNTLITWNMDKRWRKLAARACLTSDTKSVLDLCCGTGDLAIKIAEMAEKTVEISGLDFSQPMLDIAEQKASQTVGENRIKFYQGNAAKLPFADGYFNILGISFAFRNLTYKNPNAQKHVSEIVRVLKPGGRCVIAESSQPGNRLIRGFYHFYMRHYVTVMGSLVSGNKPAYRYLGDSASRYYSPRELIELLTLNGFREVSYRPLFFGASGIYVAIK
jgi:demethylmenaquinone methyltransferase / 2-methoxy-6-polyprenyl-1,4-benzoquinol methylase